jgi:hypothetical protein
MVTNTKQSQNGNRKALRQAAKHKVKVQVVRRRAKPIQAQRK